MSKSNQPQKQKRTAKQEIVSAEYSGPIPLPTHLEHYESIVPGAAERIIILAEGEAAHRREIEKMAMSADINLSGRDKNQTAAGQWLAFLIVLAFLGSGIYLMTNGIIIGGAVVSGMGVSLVGIVTAFLGKSKNKN
jgi:uncharacterized membrane protein